MQRGARWTSLDGVRGLAAASVVLFHAGYLDGGYMGVDIFFVLSGFLITGLLLSERRATGQIALGRFYARRLFRLYPALVATTAFAVIVALGTSHPFGRVLGGAAAAVLYIGNWHNYSGLLLQHVWTLALEEQFYLLWPPIVLLLIRYPRARWLAVPGLVVWAVFVFVPMSGRVGDQIDGSYLRAAGLPFGCAVALAYRRGVRAPRWLTLSCVVALVAFAIHMPTAGALVRFSPAAVVATPLILGLVTDPPPLLDRVLASAPLVWLGKRSYGLYLWHFPILSLALSHLHGPHLGRAVVGIVASLVAAELSWHFIERPFLALRDRLGRPSAPVAVPGL